MNTHIYLQLCQVPEAGSDGVEEFDRSDDDMGMDDFVVRHANRGVLLWWSAELELAGCEPGSGALQVGGARARGMRTLEWCFTGRRSSSLRDANLGVVLYGSSSVATTNKQATEVFSFSAGRQEG